MGSNCNVLSTHTYHSSFNLRVEIKQLTKASNRRLWGPCSKLIKNNSPHKIWHLKFRIFLYLWQTHFLIFLSGNLRLRILLYKTRKFKLCTTFQINWEKERSAKLYWVYRKISNLRETRNAK